MLSVVAALLFVGAGVSTTAAPTLAVSKAIQGGSNSVPSGVAFTYVINWANPSTTQAATNAVLIDNLPSQLSWASSDVTFTSSSTYVTNASFTTSTGQMKWSFVNPLPAGTSGQFTLTVKFLNGTTTNGTMATNLVVFQQTGGTTTTSAPVAITATANLNLSVSKSLYSGGAVDNWTIYKVTASNSANTGGLNVTNGVFTDTLPTGAIYVSSTGSGVYNAASNTVTWSGNTLNVNGSFTQYVTVIYPASNGFATGQQVCNNLKFTGTLPAASGSINTNAAAVCTALAAKNESASFTKTSDNATPVTNSSVFRYLIKPVNTGNTPLTNFTVTDVIPNGVIVTNIQIDPASAALGVTAGTVKLEYATGSPLVWTTVPGTPTTAFKTYAIPSGTTVTGVRWTYGQLPVSFSANTSVAATSGSGMTATLGAVAAGTVINNCADFVYTNYLGTIKTGTSCVSVTATGTPALVAAMAATKSVSPTGAVAPGTTLTYTISATESSTATTPLINPVLTDLLPAGLVYLPAGYTTNGWSVSAGPVPYKFEQIDNYTNGRTLLRWSYTNCNITTSTGATNSNTFRAATILFKAQVPSNAFYSSTYANSSAIVSWGNTNVSGNSTTDTFDLNGNGSKTDKIAQSSAQTTSIATSAALLSVKSVIGQLDSTYSVYPATAKSIPGGVANYKLTVQNQGSVPLTNILIIDILPFVGDAGVIDLSPRESAWRPNLASSVAAPSGVTVYYSTNTNPDRPEMGVSTTQPAVWSTVVPADISSVQSLKFDFGTTILNPLDQLELNWQMRVPTTAPTNGAVAWNSFGVVATRTDNKTKFLPTEPIKVGIQAKPIVPAVLGDFVWNDTNQNGIQDSGEAGMNGIRVELYTKTGNQTYPTPSKDTFVGFTLTAGSGNYLFANLSPGNYYTVTYLPPTYLASAARQGTNRLVDSNGTNAIVKGFSAVISDVVSLNWGDAETSMDQGFYQPTVKINAVGNFVWNDVNGNGIQDEPAANGVNGVTVDAYTSGGTLVGTATTANDINGNPGYYLIDGLTNGSYYLQFALPAGDNFTTTNAAGSTVATDSNATASGPNQGRTGVFTLTGGQYDTSLDAGLIQPTGPMSVGNLVWSDSNNNGIFDSDETGVDGVKVNLYLDSDGNGTFSPGIDQFFGTTTTFTEGGASGHYLFNNLPQGYYIIQIDPANFQAGSALGGAIPSVPQPPALANTQIDNDNNGYAVDGYGAFSTAVLLTVGSAPGPGDNNFDGTVDFGFVLPVTIGDHLWVDTNGNGIQDADEPGIGGVGITLTGTNLNGLTLTNHVVSSAAGNYTFVEPPGTYVVSIDATNFTGSGVLNGYSATLTGQGATDVDSNSSPSGTTPAFLTSGLSDVTLDFGFYKPVTFGNFVWNDTNHNGVQDGGETGMAGVTLTATRTNLDGTVFTDQVTTSASGAYLFTEAPGTYTVSVDATNFNSGGKLFNFAATVTGAGTTSTDNNGSPSGTSPSLLTSGSSDLTVDFGYVPFGSVTGLVYKDLNGNGVMDAGDTTTAGISVVVTDSSGSSQTVVTASGGTWSATVAPGAVTVSVSNDAAFNSYFSTNAVQTQISSTGTSVLQQVVNLGNNGYFNPSGLSSISGQVRNDTRNSGLLTDLNPGIAGVTVGLYFDANANGIWDAGDFLIETTTTSDGGSYAFSNLAAYNYVVVQTVPVGATATNDKDGISPINNGKNVIAVSLSPSTVNTANDFLDYYPGTVGGVVYRDVNGNGVKDAGDTTVAGITINLTDSLGLVHTVTTAPDGSWSSIVPPGTVSYTVSHDAAFTAAFGPNAIQTQLSTGGTAVAGQTVGVGNNGYFNPSGSYKIAGQVRNDANNNGLLTDSESAIAGVTLKLYFDANGDGIFNAGDTLVTSTNTASNGNYSFPNLASGKYVVVQTVPAGATATNDKDGISPINNGKNAIAVTLSGNSNANDFLDYYPGTVSGVVYKDVNGNGTKDSGDTTSSGITVVVTDVFGTTRSTTTAVDGTWSVSVPPGAVTYTITKDAAFTSAFGTNAVQTQTSTSGTAVAGQTVNVGNNGYFNPTGSGSIAGQVRNDINNNGMLSDVEAGIPGVTVKLYLDVNGNGKYDAVDIQLGLTATDTSGSYSFTNLAPAKYVVAETVPAGASATNDKDGIIPINNGKNVIAVTSTGASIANDFLLYGAVLAPISGFVYNDVNNNGLFDAPAAGDEGIAGVTNRVYADVNANGIYDAGDVLVGTDVTADDGSYKMAGLLTGQNYVVVQSVPTQATAILDTDGDSNGFSTILVKQLPPAGSDGNNFLDFQPAIVTGLVYFDANVNGMYDAGDVAQAGVTVKIIDSNGVGYSVVTDKNGQYQQVVPPGNVTVDVQEPTITGINSPTLTRDTFGEGTDPKDLTATAGQTVTNYTGYIVQPPTAGELSILSARRTTGLQVDIRWSTLVEYDVIGYQVERLQLDGSWKALEDGAIQAWNNGRPNTYEVGDSADFNHTVSYRLLKWTSDGQAVSLGTTTLEPGPLLGLSMNSDALQLSINGRNAGKVMVETSTLSPSGPWVELKEVQLDGAGMGFVRLAIQHSETSRFYRLSER